MIDLVGFDDVQPLGQAEVRLSPRRTTRVIRDWREALATLQPGESVAWDLETGGLDPWRAPIAVISLYGERSQIPCVLHFRGSIPPEVKRFMQSSRLWVGHNVTCFDRLFLERNGVDTFATGIEHYDTLVGEGVAKTSGRHDVRVNLQATIARRIGRKITKSADHNSWMNPSLDEQQLAYCVDDIMALHRIREEQLLKVGEEDRLRAMDTEQALCEVVVSMILTGLPLDSAALSDWHTESKQRMREAGDRLREVIGRPLVEDLPPATKAKERAAAFNLSSPLQLRQFILDRYDVTLADTKKASLEELAGIDNDVGQLAKDVLTWRPGKKRTSMYDETWLWKYVQADGRIHGRFWQLGTETGRFSSTDPNLEQWPRDGRRVLGGEPGTCIVQADYDAIEVMIAAGLAKDEQLLEDCLGDPHASLAEFMTGIPAAELKKEERRLAKAANFTMLFCGGWKRFHAQCRLGDRSISDTTTREYYDRYLRRYRGVDRMRNRAFAMSSAGVVTLDFPSGLRRVLAGPDITPTRIVNNAVQGTAAAGAKFGMLELHRRGLARGYLGSMVHDELVSVVPQNMANEYAGELAESMIVGMKQAIPGIPVRASAKVGTHWS